MGFAAALFAFWQSGRLVSLIDYTYLVENTYRIYIGQTPYRDFMLSLTPGTYLVMAFVWKLFGVSNMTTAFYSMTVAFLTIILSYYVLNRINNRPVLNLFLTAPLIFCGQSITPFPSYDNNTMLFMLLSLLFLFRIIGNDNNVFKYFLAGFLLALPMLFKQNTGLVFNVIALLVLFITSIFSKHEISFRNFLNILAGSTFVYLLLLLWLLYNHSFHSFINQVFIYPGATRNPFKMSFLFFRSFFLPQTLLFNIIWLAGFFLFCSRILSSKRKTILLIITAIVSMAVIPIAIIVIIGRYDSQLTPLARLQALFSYCFSIWHLSILVLSLLAFKNLFFSPEEKFSFLNLFAVIPLLVAISSFLSQGVAGSSYGIWPLLAIMQALIAKYAIQYWPEIQWHKIFATLSIILLITLFSYSYTNIRRKFVSHEGTLQKCTYPGLEHLATPGPWIGEMEGMFRFIDANIPKNDLIVSIPGEDPICVATLRKPALSFFQLNPITFYPHNGEYVFAECIRNKIKWVIVKTHLQMTGLGGFIDCSILEQKIKDNYKLYSSINGYDIYIKEDFQNKDQR